jgi:hypothetical protein
MLVLLTREAGRTHSPVAAMPSTVMQASSTPTFV